MIRTTLLLTLLCLLYTNYTFAQAPTPVFSATPVAGCSPLVVSFTDASTGNPGSWYWDFGNGATSTLKNPSTTYFIPGNYSVSLTVTNADGSKSVTRSNYITVYANPSVSFKGNDSVGCYPFPVQFADNTTTSTGTTNTSWLWDFGDGTQSTVQNPRNIFSNSGNYTVSLRVINDKGCWSVATKHGYIKIEGGIESDFDYKRPVSCHTPFVVSFTNSTKGPGVLSYAWQFGDGTTSTEENPSHTYTNAGVYTVTLITKSSNGCIDTVRKENFLTLQNTTTAFTAPDSACVNEAVTFRNTSSAGAVTSYWNFGDGTTSSEKSPSKTFSTPGVYTVKLLQTYGFCADSAVRTVHVFPRPVAGFTVDKKAHCQPPLRVSFQNTSTGAVTYLWNFGDGNTSTESSPSHTYTGYGSFDVTLTATNAFGCTDVLKIPGSVNVAKPSIKFLSLPQNGCIPYTVNFTAAITSPDPVVSYLWDFGNGVTSTEERPSYTYTQQGDYRVSLTIVTSSGCTETAVYAAAVTVGRKPEVKFSALPPLVCAYQKVVFADQTNEGTGWTWLFGDGGTSSERNPVYQYSDTGTFSVKLIVNNNGCFDSLEIPKYITVKPPIANFTYLTSCANKLSFTFKDKSIGANAWHWDFGDGTTSTDINPVHTFPAYGRYTVQLTVNNDTCFHIKKTVINIVNGTPDFSASEPAVCKGSAIQFTADSTNAANIVSYSWNFGDGAARGSGRETSVTYDKAGMYTVSLTVTDSYGCIDSTVKKQAITIHGPTAGILAKNNNGCKGLEANFTDASKDDGSSKIVQWNWDMGDGAVHHQTTPEPIRHVYAKSGSFTVSLQVTDGGGCSDSLAMPSLVNVSDIKAAFAAEDTLSCPGADIRFNNTSKTLTAYQSLWRFGDGSTSTEQNPGKAYRADGLYSVSLYIRDLYGCADSVTRKDYIAIKHPVASFTVNDSSSTCIPFQVQYTNTSSNYNQHVWNLSGGTNRLVNPTQYYNFPGVYETKLVVTSPGGCTDTATKKISVYDISASRVDYLPLNGCKPLTVNLKATSPVKMDLIWDFGDGTIISSNDTEKQHVYNFFGDFVPKIIMKNSAGCVIAVTGLDTIRIKGATAKFDIDKRLFCDSGVVRFSDSTTFNNPITAYNWNFGDGYTSTLSSPSHKYKQPGIYQVSLSVQTANQCVDTFRLRYPVTVVNSPAIRIGGDSVICAGEGLTHLGLLNRQDTSQVRWAWKFPNLRTAAVQMPPKQFYREAGIFVVQSIATNSSGCRDTAYQNIYVNPIPSVKLPATITTKVGTPVLLPAVYSTTMQSYRWSVPDGLNCTTCPQPLATPKMDTKYNVAFVDSNGCRNTGQVQVLVLCNNDNVFVPNTFSPNGDGSNDIFYVRGSGLSRVKTLRIFNRWGQVVFERVNFNVNDASMGWDGTFKGAKAVPDVYVYQVEIFCDNNQVIKFDGNVALIQ